MTLATSGLRLYRVGFFAATIIAGCYEGRVDLAGADDDTETRDAGGDEESTDGPTSDEAGDPGFDDVDAEDGRDGSDAEEDSEPTLCGNGMVEGMEECDDGNSVSGDGCEADCRYSCHANSECDDGAPCSADACMEVDLGRACRHDPGVAWCLIDSRCYGAAAPDPTSSCRYCEPAENQRAWTLRAAP
jgi:cysteine-rich repeat protein